MVRFSHQAHRRLPPVVVCASFVAITWLLFQPTAAQAAGDPQLIKDVNTLPIDQASLCGSPVAYNGSVFFCGANYELWQSDGTEAGTRPVKKPDGLIVTDPGDLVVAGDWLYFTSHGYLWRTDGTIANTAPIRDADGRVVDPDPPELSTDVDGELFFFRFNLGLSFLHELWKTDGTDAGTVRVKLFNPRLNPNDAAAINGQLLFTNYEHELWKSDGTEAGTVLLQDIAGRNYSDENNNLTNVGGTLFFSMENINVRDLWKSDGTAAGTELVKAGISEQYMSVGNFEDVDGTLFLLAESNYTNKIVWRSDGTSAGTQPVTTLISSNYGSFSTLGFDGHFYYASPEDGGLWRTDGTGPGTQLAADVDPSGWNSLAAHAGRVYFSAANGSGLGYELWSTDGSVAGTRLIRDIHLGAPSASPQLFASGAAGLFFQATAGKKLGGPSLWLTDGTPAGTEQVADISDPTGSAYPSASTMVGDQVYYLANFTRVPTTNQEWQLWKTDGTVAGTGPVLDLIEETTADGEYYGDEYAFLAGAADQLFVSGRSIASGWGMWRTDGTPAGTAELPNIVPGTTGRPYTFLTSLDERVFFFAETNGGNQLRRIAPGQATATLVVDGLVGPGTLQVVQDQLVFTDNVDDLWLSDGTAAGTRRIKSLALADDTRLDDFQAFGDGFVFCATWNYNPYGNPNRAQLWISNGTGAGTVPLLNDCYSYNLLITADAIYYGDYNGLWVTDGTPGTALLLLARDDIRGLTEAGGTVYFSVENQSLWKTNGTVAGTRQVRSGLSIQSMAELNGQLYFTAYLAADGGGYYTDSSALWKSDGTNAGTVIVQSGLEYIRSLKAPQQNLFVARQGSDFDIYLQPPDQIFETDGSAAGTVQLSDFQEYSSFDASYARTATELYLGEELIFSFDDGIKGQELWVLDTAGNGAGDGLLGDFTWWDQDEDGIQDPAEPGLGDVAVALEDCTGRVIATTRSRSDGRYVFSSLAPGSYQLRFTLPTGFVHSPAQAGGDYTIDSNPDPDTGIIACRTLAAGQKRRGLDAGFISVPTASIGDRVWRDLDGDGRQDAAEPGFAGVYIGIEDCSTGALLETTVSSADGAYRFANLAAGEYRLRFTAPTGFVFSPKMATGDYRTDSNPDATGLVACRSIQAGQNRTAIDAGLVTVP